MTNEFENLIGEDGNRVAGPEIAPQRNHGSDILFRCADGKVATSGQVFSTHYDMSGNQKPSQNAVRYADVYPSETNVHENAALSDLAFRYELDTNMFIGPKLAPIYTVGKRTDAFYKVSKGDVSREQEIERAIGAVANDVHQSFDKDTYSVNEYALRSFIADAVVVNADSALQLMESTTRFLTQVLEFGYDRRVMALLVAGTWDDDTRTGVWSVSTPALRSIRKDFNKANAAIIAANNGAGSSHVFMNSTVALDTSGSQEITDTAKHQMGVEIVENGGWPGQNYGLPNNLYAHEVVVASIPTNSAKKGQAASFAQTFSADDAMFLLVEQPSLQTRNAITTFRLGGMVVKSYRDEHRGGVYVEVSQTQVEKITNPGGGYLVTDVLT